MYYLTKSMEFDAAHQLRNYPGKCANLHGHTYKLIVCVAGEHINELGLLFDFGEIKVLMKAIVDRFDHHYINEIPPYDEINPTAETMSYHIYQELKYKLVSHNPILKLAYVEVWETPTCSSRYSED